MQKDSYGRLFFSLSSVNKGNGRGWPALLKIIIITPLWKTQVFCTLFNRCTHIIVHKSKISFALPCSISNPTHKSIIEAITGESPLYKFTY